MKCCCRLYLYYCYFTNSSNKNKHFTLEVDSDVLDILSFQIITNACTILYHIPCRTVLYPTVPCWSVLYCTIPCWTVLYCTTPYHCWTMLFCTTYCRWAQKGCECMQNNNSRMPAHFFLIKKKHGLKLPLCLMRHHTMMTWGTWDAASCCSSFTLGKNVAVYIELSGSVREERHQCVLARNWTNFRVIYLDLTGNFMEQLVFSGYAPNAYRNTCRFCIKLLLLLSNFKTVIKLSNNKFEEIWFSYHLSFTCGEADREDEINY